MPAQFPKVTFTAFEQALTTDLNRISNLTSRELQDMLKYWGASDSEQNLTTGANDPLGTAGQQPLTGADLLPSVAKSGSAFTLDIGAGRAYKNSATGVGVDDSSYQLFRWAAQTVTHTTPHATLDRVDLVVAALGFTQADPVLRNILVDPVARTVAQQTITKTQNPLSAVTVITGTAAASPSAPYSSVPADSMVLFEVYVPAAVANASFFNVSRQLFKRAAYPVSSYTGVIQGCTPVWGAGSNETTDNLLPSLNGSSGVHKVVISGQVLTATAGANGFSMTTYRDQSADPLGSAAPAGNDRPFYVYLCGGSLAPIGAAGTSGGIAGSTGAPFAMVVSTTAPNPNGHASSDLSITRQFNGANQVIPKAATCYVGIGFTIAGSTRSKSCWIEGDWVHAGGPPGNLSTLPCAFERFQAFNGTLGASSETANNVKLASCPTVSSAVRLYAQADVSDYDGATALPTSLRMTYFSNGNANVGWVQWFANDDSTNFQESPLIVAQARITPSDAQQFILRYRPQGLDTVSISALPYGYNMNVPRLGPGGI